MKADDGGSVLMEQSKDNVNAEKTYDALREEAYKMAKQIRAGNRELARQLNTKKTKKQR